MMLDKTYINNMAAGVNTNGRERFGFVAVAASNFSRALLLLMHFNLFTSAWHLALTI